jgi:hypothetical protein
VVVTPEVVELKDDDLSLDLQLDETEIKEFDDKTGGEQT